jgi:prefoldin subunit 5
VNDQLNQTEALAIARIAIARLEVEVAHLRASLAAVEESNQELTAKLDQVLLTLSEARGGWKTLMVVGGAASAVGGVITWLAQHFVKG